MLFATLAFYVLCFRPCATMSPVPAVAAPENRAAPTKDFWESIAKNNYSPPAGQSAAELSHSLSAMLGSPDPDLRDEIAYTTLTNWIYEKRLLSPADLRPLITEWLGNLSRDVGSVGSDAVLRRSFSALMLSVVVARDNAAPFLEEKEFRNVLNGAIAYADAEKDLRAYDAEKGWMHSAAHTADLLKFLGRSRYATTADQAAILAAVSRKLHSAGTVFAFGEDERMARAVLSIVARPDFDVAGFRQWLALCKPVAPTTARPQIAELATYQNLKNTLAKLVLILLALPPESPHVKEAVAAVQDTIKGTF